jgi:uncharacterized membrane protein
VSIGLIAAVIAMSIAAYPSLPDRIPIHWNIQGEIDGWCAKGWGVSLIPLTMIIFLLIFRTLPWLSPKQFTLDSFYSTYEFIVLILLTYLTYIQGVLLWSAIHPKFDAARAIVGGVCLMFASLGNVLGKVRRNFWVGIRTPWTIASERVWNTTHRLAARLFVWAGVVGLLAAIVGLPPMSMFVIMLSGILFASLAPVAYSLYLYKVLERRGELEPDDNDQLR